MARATKRLRVIVRLTLFVVVVLMYRIVRSLMKSGMAHLGVDAETSGLSAPRLDKHRGR